MAGIASASARGRSRALRAAPARALLLAGLLLAAASAHAFDFNDVVRDAQALSTKSYKRPVDNLPKDVKALSYDQYTDITYRPEKNVWRAEKLPFELSFSHEGSAYNLPVKINEIVGNTAREIKFSPDLFDYGNNKLNQDQLRSLGFAGVQVQYPINSNKTKSDVFSLLGASYFRALGKGQNYGVTARGLAVDTALQSGEEFPRFVEVWIDKPSMRDKELTIYALLDSASVTGAYRFILKPGVETTIDVKAQLYLRKGVSKLGVAPLTSMYYFGTNQRSDAEDFRPQVHDSDGLMMHAGNGEWLWRPLVNPKRLLVTSFGTTDPLGFGLMQRDRSFANYEDLGARFETRPSLWVTPKGKWGEGRVELVQIPTPNEDNDNIVAYWVPAKTPPPGTPIPIEYRLSWQKETDTRPTLAWVAQTRRSNGNPAKPDDSIMLSVDFEGPGLVKRATDSKLSAAIEADDNGKLLETRLVRNDVSGGWRMVIRLRRNDENKPIELRGFLRDGNTPLSETWSYILPPN
ncbi:MAG: mdoG [Herbaspirillum sp.]|nr:mdoG [Herbaspirillum sp.]